MKYKCPNCGHESEQAGNCPTCNVPMTEVVQEAPGEKSPEASGPQVLSGSEEQK